jgi:hypothetical protein
MKSQRLGKRVRRLSLVAFRAAVTSEELPLGSGGVTPERYQPHLLQRSARLATDLLQPRSERLSRRVAVCRLKAL